MFDHLSAVQFLGRRCSSSMPFPLCSVPCGLQPVLCTLCLLHEDARPSQVTGTCGVRGGTLAIHSACATV
eukprot:14484310-Alexandrium_andersonii.AAC.1